MSSIKHQLIELSDIRGEEIERESCCQRKGHQGGRERERELLSAKGPSGGKRERVTARKRAIRGKRESFQKSTIDRVKIADQISNSIKNG